MENTLQATNTNKADLRVSMRWAPKDSRKIEHALGVCYVTEHMNGPQNEPWKQRQVFTVLAYSGTAQKSTFYESHRTAESRDKRVAEFFAGLESSAAFKAERRSERNKPHNLVVGDIIYNSWGWEQTNIDWYVIVKKTANYVWLQPIAAQSVPSEGCAPMSGHCEPELPVRQITEREVRDYGEYDEVSGHRPVTLKTVAITPTMHKAEGKSVTFKHGCGSAWDGRPKYESWYA